MSWDTLINQKRVASALRRAIERERVAHAYLFHGPQGVGKRAVALVFAQALQCEEEGSMPCNACPPCNKVRRMVHPDVHVLFAEPSDVDPEDVARRRERLAEEPYATVDFVRRPALDDPSASSNKQAFYSIARINEDLRQSMSYKPVEGRYKVCIMTDADLLRTEAANAFLKLLEEPAPRTVFILNTSRPDRLLPTILSRCQRFRFDSLTHEDIEKALVQRAGLDGEKAAPLARMADGSYSRALDLMNNDQLMAGRKLVIGFLRQAYLQNINKQADLVQQMSKMGRERVKGLLRLMLRWIRDLVLYRVVGAEAALVNVDQRRSIARFCENVPDADLEAMIDIVEQAIEMAGRNVHLGLLLTVLSQALGRAMRGSQAGRLFRPLDVPKAAVNV